jgi:hypothetical protein
MLFVVAIVPMTASVSATFNEAKRRTGSAAARPSAAACMVYGGIEQHGTNRYNKVCIPCRQQGATNARKMHLNA